MDRTPECAPLTSRQRRREPAIEATRRRAGCWTAGGKKKAIKIRLKTSTKVKATLTVTATDASGNVKKLSRSRTVKAREAQEEEGEAPRLMPRAR
jgi:hypothetical protein